MYPPKERNFTLINPARADVHWSNFTVGSKTASSKTEGILWCSVFSAVFLFIVVGNSLTIILFTANRSLHKKSLYLVINLALADLLYGGLSLPLYIYRLGGMYQLWNTLWNHQWQIAFHVVDAVFAQASIINLAFISAERLLVVIWPIKHRSLVARDYVLPVVLVWVVSILIASVCLSFQYATSMPMISFYVWLMYVTVSLLTICGCYSGVWVSYRSRKLAAHHQNRAAQENKLTKTLSIITIVSLVLWLPVGIYNIVHVQRYTVYTKNYLSAMMYCDLLNYCNSLANPILYAMRSQAFRRILPRCDRPANVERGHRRPEQNPRANNTHNLRTVHVAAGLGFDPQVTKDPETSIGASNEPTTHHPHVAASSGSQRTRNPPAEQEEIFLAPSCSSLH